MWDQSKKKTPFFLKYVHIKLLFVWASGLWVILRIWNYFLLPRDPGRNKIMTCNESACACMHNFYAFYTVSIHEGRIFFIFITRCCICDFTGRTFVSFVFTQKNVFWCYVQSETCTHQKILWFFLTFPSYWKICINVKKERVESIIYVNREKPPWMCSHFYGKR